MRTLVVSTVDGAVLRALDGVGADGGVPGVAGVAVVASAGRMEPAPVRVEHDGVLLRLAVVAGRALLDRQAGVVLRRERADLLTVGGRKKGEREESGCGEHCDARETGREAVVSSMQSVEVNWAVFIAHHVLR